MSMSRYKLITSLATLLVLNLLFFDNFLIKSVVTSVFFLTYAILASDWLFPRASSLYMKFTLGLVVTMTVFTITGALVFYVWRFDIITIILITTLIQTILSRKRDNVLPAKASIRITVKNIISSIKAPKHWAYLAYTALVGLALSVLARSQTFDAIQSPWEVIPTIFIVLYFLASILLVTNIMLSGISKDNFQIHLFFVSIHLFLTYSITTIVYGLNFGFDPFVHQASEKLLSSTGTITPKPLLYMGQYSIVVLLAKISDIAITTIDRFLLPIISSIVLPATIYYSFTKSFNISPKSIIITTLSIPILLLPFFFSVPQNIGNLFLLLTLILSIPMLSKKGSSSEPVYTDYLMLLILGISTFFIHPFSGVPALIYVSLIAINNFRNRLKNIIFIVFSIISTFAIPLTLIIGSSFSGNSVSTQPSNIFNIKYEISDIAQWIPFYSNLHTIEFFASNHVFLMAIATISGIWALKNNNKMIIKLLLTTFTIVSINAITLRWIPIPIVRYEIPEFIARFWQIAFIFLVPIILFAISRCIDIIIEFSNKTHKKTDTERSENHINNTPPYARNVHAIALIFFLSLFITSSMYVLYPRVDVFAKSRAFATSQYDIESVRWIEQDANGRNYITLANQAVSASALQEFGFKKYYKTNPCNLQSIKNMPNKNCTPKELFYYPIPTTSPLYDIYLDMVYKSPTKNRLLKAMDIAGVDVGYFVINDYWLDFEKIAEKAKSEFTGYKIIGNEKVYIFKLEK